MSNIDIYPQNKLFARKENGKWGYTDKNGIKKVDYIYDMVTEYNFYGFAGIKKGDKWGVLDFSGKVLVEPKYKIDETTNPPDFIGKYYKTRKGLEEIYYTDQINEEGN